MPFHPADVGREYSRNEGLRKEDIKTLEEWITKQPHLPKISELHLILFLQSCYYSVERAKSAIDTFYSLRTHCPEIFANRDPCLPSALEFMNVCLYAPLSLPTPENFQVLYCQLIDGDPNHMKFYDQLKSFDMNIMLWLMQEGTQEGLIVVVNMEKAAFGHLAKLNVVALKTILLYVQEALPIRLRGVHFINVATFMDKLLALMKPFIKNELMDILHFHTTSIESLYDFVPRNILPTEIGGSVGTVTELHERMKEKFQANADYFREEKLLVVDETRRPGKPKTAGDLFGIEGSFRKLDID